MFIKKSELVVFGIRNDWIILGGFDNYFIIIVS